MRIIEGRLSDELYAIATARMPEEAVGLILSDDRIIELTNHSESPRDSFMVNRQDIMNAVQGYLDLSDVVLWHTHPGGGIGPSRLDLQHKTPFNYHLVISLVEGDMVYSWY